jgi:glucan phosphoethanolaminetransferase (alkaline phosphatase superfamily)
MKKELAEQFNQEVEQHRKSLLHFARSCDWTSFKERAGKLFDYVEFIEILELERRFFRVFFSILAALLLFSVAIFSFDFEVHQDLLRYKTALIMCALAVSSYEIYFFLTYRHYAYIKNLYYRRRREEFVRDIEQDFLVHARTSDQKAA